MGLRYANTSLRAFVGMLCLLALAQPCCGTGKIKILMESYSSSCSDNWFFDTACDTFFEMCIDRPGDVDFNSCDYGKYGPSSHYENNNDIQFVTDHGYRRMSVSSVGGISNPMVVSVDVFLPNPQVMFAVKVMDDEFFQSDEHLATLLKVVSFTPAENEADARWGRDVMSSGSYRVRFRYQAYCDAHYYTLSCGVFCRARDDSRGHYSCHQITGQKLCHPGWGGEDCATDINECLLGPCYNNAPCSNLPGTYECRCKSGLTGKNCDLVSSLCHSAPCQNGGQCYGDQYSYTCSCPAAWTGHNCDTAVDFCQPNPCDNNGTCDGTVGTFTCLCAAGWTGSRCRTEVDACHSQPCQHGAECFKRPHGQYVCNCNEDYEGRQCERQKDPCKSSPCMNSGTCVRLSYDRYNCTCLPDWYGSRCNYQTIDVTTSQKQSSEANWLVPVGCFLVLIVLIGIFIVIRVLIYRDRKKRRKQTVQDVNVQCVVNDSGIHVSKLSYEESNRFNALWEQATHRAPQHLPDSLPPPPYHLHPVKSAQTATLSGAAHGTLSAVSQSGVCAGKGKDGEEGRGTGRTVGDGGGNDYASFEQLIDRSASARDARAPSGYSSDCAGEAVGLEQGEEEQENHNHYDELDNVLAIGNMDDCINIVATSNSQHGNTVDLSVGSEQLDQLPSKYNGKEDDDDDDDDECEGIDAAQKNSLYLSDDVRQGAALTLSKPNNGNNSSQA